jgi:hypothetical protein
VLIPKLRHDDAGWAILVFDTLENVGANVGVSVAVVGVDVGAVVGVSVPSGVGDCMTCVTFFTFARKYVSKGTPAP